MKSRLIIIGLLISQISFSQSELDKVVNGSCACITESTADVFDYDSYLKDELLLLGKLVKQDDGTHRFQKV